MIVYICNFPFQIPLSKTKPFIETSRPYPSLLTASSQRSSGRTFVYADNTFYRLVAGPRCQMNMISTNDQCFEFLTDTFGFVKYHFRTISFSRLVIFTVWSFCKSLHSSRSLWLPSNLCPSFTYPLLSPCSHVPYVVHVTIYPINFAILEMLILDFLMCN
jgi:hypothetical protein